MACVQLAQNPAGALITGSEKKESIIPVLMSLMYGTVTLLQIAFTFTVAFTFETAFTFVRAW